jgi:hypothetical protein
LTVLSAETVILEAYVEVASRMGLSPEQRCATDANCPDIFRLTDGRFAIVGSEAPEELRTLLPQDARLGPDERIVIIDAVTMIHAARDVVTQLG